MNSATVADRIASVRARIALAAQRAGRDAARVRVVAVAKTASEAALREAWDAGQRVFGHNRVQALQRDHAILPLAEWHAIGPLQGNKLRDALLCASWIQVVGEARTAERLERAVQEPSLARSARLPVLLQASLNPTDGRYGCRLDALPALADAVQKLPSLDLRGLMAIGAATADPGSLRRGFANLREAAEKLTSAGVLPLSPELSMGMSDDFEIAVEEGATLVRVGRTIFPPASER
ncbi:MAG: YggS family pyridoxal phosphate-dependent enzyme [Planctomycetota bacterium]|nr:YggS family pyridoxal phosphate-dependent enzyme [Planctomycetota bacterium]